MRNFCYTVKTLSVSLVSYDSCTSNSSLDLYSIVRKQFDSIVKLRHGVWAHCAHRVGPPGGLGSPRATGNIGRQARMPPCSCHTIYTTRTTACAFRAVSPKWSRCSRRIKVAVVLGNEAGRLVRRIFAGAYHSVRLHLATACPSSWSLPAALARCPPLAPSPLRQRLWPQVPTRRRIRLIRSVRV